MCPETSQDVEAEIQRLKTEIEALFRSVWSAVREGTAPCSPNPGAQGEGSVHLAKEKLSFFDKVRPDGWDTKLATVLRLYRES